MKKAICLVLALAWIVCGGIAAEGESYSITTGRPTGKASTVMVVQLDNEPGARPQKGIVSADIVYEIELYNGGYTRYTAIFNDIIPERIEAVRSARIVNADVYTEYNGAFVHYGGRKEPDSNVYDYFEEIDVGARYDGIIGLPEFTRDSNRKVPNNVICRLGALYAQTDWASISCKSPLKFNAAFAVPQGEDATRFVISYRESSYVASYRWDTTVNGTGRYLRFYNDKKFVDGLTGEQVACDNVIVQSVEYEWLDDKGEAPKVTVTGSGRCEYFIGGKHFSGTWRRDSVTRNTVYMDAAGNEVLFNPGVTYIQFLKTEKSVEILE